MPLKTSVSKCMWPIVINLNFNYVALLYAARMLVEMEKLKQSFQWGTIVVKGLVIVPPVQRLFLQ